MSFASRTLWLFFVFVYTLCPPLWAEDTAQHHDRNNCPKDIIVVGHRDENIKTRNPARFTDDEAYAIAQVLAGMPDVDSLSLLTDFDEESEGTLFETMNDEELLGLLKGVRPSSIVALKNVWSSQAKRLVDGCREFVLLYLGNVVRFEGRAYLSFSDGYLSRHELKTMVSGLPHERISLFIDAPHAYHFLNGPPIQPYLEHDNAEELRGRFQKRFWPENLRYIGQSGVGAQRSERVALRSSLFQVLLRNALSGQADLDRDLQISEDELRGYLQSAGFGLENVSRKVRLVASKWNIDSDSNWFLLPKHKQGRVPQLKLMLKEWGVQQGSSNAERIYIFDALGLLWWGGSLPFYEKHPPQILPSHSSIVLVGPHATLASQNTNYQVYLEGRKEDNLSFINPDLRLSTLHGLFREDISSVDREAIRHIEATLPPDSYEADEAFVKRAESLLSLLAKTKRDARTEARITRSVIGAVYISLGALVYGLGARAYGIDYYQQAACPFQKGPYWNFQDSELCSGRVRNDSGDVAFAAISTMIQGGVSLIASIPSWFASGDERSYRSYLEGVASHPYAKERYLMEAINRVIDSNDGRVAVGRTWRGVKGCYAISLVTVASYFLTLFFLSPEDERGSAMIGTSLLVSGAPVLVSSLADFWRARYTDELLVDVLAEESRKELGLVESGLVTSSQVKGSRVHAPDSLESFTQVRNTKNEKASVKKDSSGPVEVYPW